MRRVAAAVFIVAVAQVSSAAAIPGDNTGASNTTVIGGGDDVEVIVENDGGEIVVLVGTQTCTFHKLTVLELAELPGLPVDLPPEQAGQFVSRIEPDGTIAYLYVRQCGQQFLHFWIRDLPPDDVVERARQELLDRAPAPAAVFSPGAGVNHLVGLATFVWLEGDALEPIVVTATIPGLSATATATPSRLTLDPGDGSDPVDCSLDTSAYIEGADAGSNCTHVYRRVSSISEGGTWDFTVSLEWDVTWVNSLGDTGLAEPLTTTAIFPLTVIEIQARTTNGD